MQPSSATYSKSYLATQNKIIEILPKFAVTLAATIAANLAAIISMTFVVWSQQFLQQMCSKHICHEFAAT
jgi:hypothetical protein